MRAWILRAYFKGGGHWGGGGVPFDSARLKVRSPVTMTCARRFLLKILKQKEQVSSDQSFCYLPLYHYWLVNKNPKKIGLFHYTG